MKTLLLMLATTLFVHAAFADDFQSTVDKALAAGEPAAIVKALEKEVYRSNLVAAQQLGFMYRDDKQVAQDRAAAREWLEIAATKDWKRGRYKRGLQDAQYALGVMLRDGIGGSADAKKAASWFEQAAEQGNVDAKVALAEMYLHGDGIRQNIKQAYIWASIAADQLSNAALKKVEAIRDAAKQQLEPAQLHEAQQLISDWAPKSI